MKTVTTRILAEAVILDKSLYREMGSPSKLTLIYSDADLLLFPGSTKQVYKKNRSILIPLLDEIRVDGDIKKGEFDTTVEYACGYPIYRVRDCLTKRFPFVC